MEIAAYLTLISLRKKELTVAGVQKRVYKNSVYKIVGRNNTRIYLAAEYATPLKTFNDVVNHNGEHSNNYKKHKNEIVLQFYLTLQKVLNEFKSCTDFCELIFYDDVKQIDPDGKTIYHDVGEILLNRLKEIKRRNRTFPQVIAKLGNRWKEIVFFSFTIIPVVVAIFCHITSHPTVD